jgi:hypothetical protein
MSCRHLPNQSGKRHQAVTVCYKLTAFRVHPGRIQEFTSVRYDIYMDTTTVGKVKLFNDERFLELLLFGHLCTLCVRTGSVSKNFAQ